MSSIGLKSLSKKSFAFSKILNDYNPEIVSEKIDREDLFDQVPDMTIPHYIIRLKGWLR